MCQASPDCSLPSLPSRLPGPLQGHRSLCKCRWTVTPKSTSEAPRGPAPARRGGAGPPAATAWREKEPLRSAPFACWAGGPAKSTWMWGGDVWAAEGSPRPSPVLLPGFPPHPHPVLSSPFTAPSFRPKCPQPSVPICISRFHPFLTAASEGPAAFLLENVDCVTDWRVLVLIFSAPLRIWFMCSPDEHKGPFSLQIFPSPQPPS